MKTNICCKSGYFSSRTYAGAFIVLKWLNKKLLESDPAWLGGKNQPHFRMSPYRSRETSVVWGGNDSLRPSYCVDFYLPLTLTERKRWLAGGSAGREEPRQGYPARMLSTGMKLRKRLISSFPKNNRHSAAMILYHLARLWNQFRYLLPLLVPIRAFYVR